MPIYRLFVCPQDFLYMISRRGLTQSDEIWQGGKSWGEGGKQAFSPFGEFWQRGRGTFGEMCWPLKTISIASCGLVQPSGARDGEIDNAAVGLVAAGHSLVRHSGRVAAWRV